MLIQVIYHDLAKFMFGLVFSGLIWFSQYM
jgi:hypothetical protein